LPVEIHVYLVNAVVAVSQRVAQLAVVMLLTEKDVFLKISTDLPCNDMETDYLSGLDNILEHNSMPETDTRLSLITNIAANYLRKNSVGADQIGSVISSITKAVRDAANELEGHAPAEDSNGAAPAASVEKSAPAVSVKKSVTREFLVCLDCGGHSRTLKRHLSTAHGLTPQAYRERWSLPKGYPMSAPAYSEKRAEMAKAIGLGQKGRSAKTPPKAKAGARGRKT
jgi:predicted transcriptional regulator